MEYRPNVEISESLRANPSATMKSISMIIPTRSKAEIIGKRIFSKTIEIENKDQEALKQPRVDSDREMIKVEDKKMKEKVQGPIVQVQEYSFVEVQESGSSNRYKSINDMYTRYGQDKRYSSEKDFNIFPKVGDISDKKISLVTI